MVGVAGGSHPGQRQVASGARQGVIQRAGIPCQPAGRMGWPTVLVAVLTGMIAPLKGPSATAWRVFRRA